MIGIWLKLNYLLYTFPYLFPISKGKQFNSSYSTHESLSWMGFFHSLKFEEDIRP